MKNLKNVDLSQIAVFFPILSHCKAQVLDDNGFFFSAAVARSIEKPLALFFEV